MKQLVRMYHDGRLYPKNEKEQGYESEVLKGGIINL